MSQSMTSRERVLTALNFQESDRVPVALGGGPYGIVDSLYFQLLDRFALGTPVAPFRSGHNISYMDDRVLEKLGTDLRYVYPGASPSSPFQATQDPNSFLDAFGQIWHKATPYFYTGQGILSQAHSLAQIDELVRWPDASDPRWTAGVAQRAKTLRENTECFITARMVTSHGPFQTACDLRGTEEFMLDLAGNEDFAAALLERIAETLAGFLKHYVEAFGDWVDMVELPGDDYAGNKGLLFSPVMFRRYFQPILKRLVAVVKETNPRLKVMLHSDGAIRKLIPELIACGVDVIHPLEPLAGVDLAAIKAEFGRQVAFLGGIDISHAMPGSIPDVRAETRLRISQLAAGGGYILAPSNHLQADVPAENVIALFDAAREFGRYPIGL
jgi:uroporphyrinogen decarboxylase